MILSSMSTSLKVIFVYLLNENAASGQISKSVVCQLNFDSVLIAHPRQEDQKYIYFLKFLS